MTDNSAPAPKELPKPLGELQSTVSGFQLIEFKDRYGNTCHIKQSSLADFTPPGSSAIWLGIDIEPMHLDLDLVKSLLPVLQQWVDTGSLEVEKAPATP